MLNMFVCIEEYKNGNRAINWFNHNDSRVLSVHLTNTILEKCFGALNNETCKGMLSQKDIKNRVESLNQTNKYNNDVLDRIVTSYESNTKENSFKQLKQHCFELNDILYKAGYEIELLCFDNEEEVETYKNIEKLSNSKLIDLLK